MDRRCFIGWVGAGTVASPLAARAQRLERLTRIGYLSPLFASPYDEAFLAGLRDLGYVEGKNLHIDFRSAEGHDDRLPKLATELVDLNVDVS
jgi:putative tryptophan/tyrosine transport system substrate-binding protein